MITFEDVKNNEEINAYIRAADKVMDAIGYTEHSFAHVTRAAEQAADILDTLGYSERTRELARIAGYMHDIGNAVNRHEHALTGAVMAFRILDNMGMSARRSPRSSPPSATTTRAPARPSTRSPPRSYSPTRATCAAAACAPAPYMPGTSTTGSITRWNPPRST